jgi:hypothetical protein
LSHDQFVTHDRRNAARRFATMHTQQGYSPGAGPPGGCSVAGAESPDWQTPGVVVTLSNVVAVDLEQRVASAVNAQLQSMNDAQLQSMNGRLEELVERALQDELDRRVAAILEANIEQRANATPPGARQTTWAE